MEYFRTSLGVIGDDVGWQSIVTLGQIAKLSSIETTFFWLMS